MTYRIPPRLAYYELETIADEVGVSCRVFLKQVPGGQTLVLVDVAALIWQIAVDGTIDIAAEVADVVGHPLDVVGPDVESYLESLVAQGLLERVSTEGPLS